MLQFTLVLGLAIAGATSAQKLCLVLKDDFKIFNRTTWQAENSLSGGGNWEYQWYTDSSENVFAKDGILHIHPTFTADMMGEGPMLNGAVVDLGANCTYEGWEGFYGCKRGSDGTHIINPIRSASIRTLNSKGIKFGKVEVKAKLPNGDWLWPAIWMLPKTQSIYGYWPASGEIDIMESRGNAPSSTAEGSNYIGSTLHWGPDYTMDRYQQTHAVKKLNYGKYSDTFHTYGLLWDPKNIVMYVDNPSNVVLNTTITDLFAKGNFPAGTKNPWTNPSSPFDQEFYLIINLAVGGNFYFDGYPNHPTSALDFWQRKSEWQKTWGSGNAKADFLIDSVKMWTAC